MLQLMSLSLPLLPSLTEMAAGLPPDNSLNPYSVFKLFVINCRGLKSKKDSFVHLIHSQSPHFIAGTESWLDPTTLSNEIFLLTIRFFETIDQMDMVGYSLLVITQSTIVKLLLQALVRLLFAGWS